LYIYSAIIIFLDAVNPLAVKYVVCRTWQDKMPSFIIHQGLIFIIFIASFQRASSRASASVLGSPIEVNKPYRIVPSVYVFGFFIPCCWRVRATTSGGGGSGEGVCTTFSSCSGLGDGDGDAFGDVERVGVRIGDAE
jgi:hypothetical protein